MGKKLRIKSKLIIAADGVDSKIAKSAGLNTKNPLTDYHSGFQRSPPRGMYGYSQRMMIQPMWA